MDYAPYSVWPHVQKVFVTVVLNPIPVLAKVFSTLPASLSQNSWNWGQGVTGGEQILLRTNVPFPWFFCWNNCRASVLLICFRICYLARFTNGSRCCRFSYTRVGMMRAKPCSAW